MAIVGLCPAACCSRAAPGGATSDGFPARQLRRRAGVRSQLEDGAPTMTHAYQMGPVKDRTRARKGRHGTLRVEGRTLLFVGNDGKQVSLTLDRGDDMIAFAAELVKAGEAAQFTDVALDLIPPEEFLSDRVLHEGDGSYSYGARS